jgi:CheY-like chemotaxis protein
MSKLPILVVDDNVDACAMLAKLLTALGYQTEVAYNATEAIDLATRGDYGLAIVDYQMPGLNGVELFRRLREIHPDLAGVFLTGHTTLDVVYPAIDAGILRVLSKPADYQELVQIIEQHLSPVA